MPEPAPLVNRSLLIVRTAPFTFGIPFGTWQDRYIDWFRDLGFLQKPGVETKAMRDMAAFLKQPPRAGGFGGAAPGQGGDATKPATRNP